MSKTQYIGYRPTWAEVNLKNLEFNLVQIKKFLKAGTKVLVTVKADAYGHGLVRVAKKLASLKVDYFGVASIDEGIVLRKEGIKLPILVLGMIFERDTTPLFKHNLTPTVCGENLARVLNKKAASLKKKINLHVKVDTGMGRIGVSPYDAEMLIKRIAKLSHLRIEGVFTHFAFADMNREFTLHQIQLFDRMIGKLEKEGMHFPLLHCANSMGVVSYKEGHFNMVRPGLVVYGLYPSEDIDLKLKPALALKTKIVYCKRVSAGQGISYGHTYITKKKTTIVTLPIGYGDGYPRNLSNVASVLIKGRRFKISGRVCMDQIMVDVGDLAVKEGEEVVLIGSQGKNKVTAEELAKLSGTIPYEIVCGLGSRVPRVYLD
ncbi:MAG: alanine racemase [Candidatus Omnitrophica bacterium]|nr:alanine racemase [Candidatus Omnitrophota bacterium]MDD5653223.1 alanine racemase [Candidatus Omnitrophota bacterium]